MSYLSKEELDQIAKIGLVLIKKLSKDELRTLSLVHDCGELDNIMDKEVNPQVAKDFPEDFATPKVYKDIQEVSREEYRGGLEDAPGCQDMLHVALDSVSEDDERIVCTFCGTENNAHHSAACVDARTKDGESDWPLKERPAKPKKGQTEGWLDVIAGRGSDDQDD